MSIKNSCKIFIFDKSACNFPEVSIFDFALSKFHILKGDPIFWQYFNACNYQCKHHFRVLFVINLNFEQTKEISEILTNLHFGAKSCFS